MVVKWLTVSIARQGISKVKVNELCRESISKDLNPKLKPLLSNTSPEGLLLGNDLSQSLKEIEYTSSLTARQWSVNRPAFSCRAGNLMPTLRLFYAGAGQKTTAPLLKDLLEVGQKSQRQVIPKPKVGATCLCLHYWKSLTTSCFALDTIQGYIIDDPPSKVIGEGRGRGWRGAFILRHRISCHYSCNEEISLLLV